MKPNITDHAISAAIRYLDPDLNEIADDPDGSVLVLCASVAIVAIGGLALMLLARRLS